MNRVHRWYCRSSMWRRTVSEDLLPWALQDVDLGDRPLEVGPGPGLTTDELRRRVPRLTSLEIDACLAGALRARLDGTNVTVVEGDATAMPFEDGSFSSTVSFTMLHHVSTRRPSAGGSSGRGSRTSACAGRGTAARSASARAVRRR